MSKNTIGDLASQYRLPFPETISGFDDLAITDANRAAFAAIRRWEDWQASALCLIGPVKSGLGIAARLWAREAEATLLSGAALDDLALQEVEAMTHTNSVIDLADRASNESHLLMLLNLSKKNGTYVLLTARSSGRHWGVQSPDLKSRLDAMPIAEIYPPDEPMISARLRASFRQRYIKLGENTIDYLAVRLPRSYEAIEDYVARLDQAISDTGRPPSINLARNVLEDGLSTRKLFDDRVD